MKSFIMFVAGMGVFFGLLALLPKVENHDCMVQFDTSQGKNQYQVASREVANVYEYEREDKDQPAISCNWLYCTYPKIKGATLSMRDLVQVRVRDSVEVAKAKLKVCGKIVE